MEEAWKLYNGEASLLNKIKESDCWIYIKIGDEYFSMDIKTYLPYTNIPFKLGFNWFEFGY